MYRGNLEIPESLLVTRGDSGNSISTAVRATARYRGELRARPRDAKFIIPAVPLVHVTATRARADLARRRPHIQHRRIEAIISQLAR